MEACRFAVEIQLEGWQLFWAHLELAGEAAEDLKRLRAQLSQKVRSRVESQPITSLPAVGALRNLFKNAGSDPSRYRPSSEALLRRIARGDEIPEIHPLVDLNNCLSVALAVPCCVMREESFEPPLVFRAGLEGESYQSLKGPFNLHGKPLLLDARGPLDAPITGSARVKIDNETRRAWMVAYLPTSAVTARQAEEALLELANQVPAIRVSPVSAP